MSKIQYRFNTKSLSVERVNKTFKDRLKVFLRYAFAGLVFSVIVLIVGFTFFESPKERILKREIAQFKVQYQLLNDRISAFEYILADMQERDDNIYRVIFEADPIPRPIRDAAFGGTDRYAHLASYQNSELMSRTMQRIDQLASQLYVQSKSYDEVFQMALNKADMLSSIPAIVPVELSNRTRLSSGYGMRIHPIYKTMRMHHGVDFTADIGTPIYSPGNGIVTRAERNRHGYGLLIEIDHGYGYVTRYAHLSTLGVRVGQEVVRGEIIGKVGNTGSSTAPHLHYEVHRNGRTVNPVYYFFNDLSPEEFEIIIERASRINQSLS
ncbi:MAG: M23 family metallopeptidase [Bacteroidia bacterium]|nr:MAG: M23 family metallopeptidase [Bacteroidia bacterium]